MARVACRNCYRGRVPIGVHYVTREMALDAGMPELEGQIAETETEQCQCCDGNWQNCERCSSEAKRDDAIF
jgi:hypothetical protein